MESPNVLIIEDDPVTRRVVRAIFEPVGWRVAEAANGDDALQRVAVESFRLIVLDLAMPVLDGYVFLDCLDRTGPAAANIPVVLLTSANLSARDKQRFRGRVALMIEKQSGPNGMHRQLETVARAYLKSES